MTYPQLELSLAQLSPSLSAIINIKASTYVNIRIEVRTKDKYNSILNIM